MKRYLIIGAVVGAFATLVLAALLAVGVFSYRVVRAQSPATPAAPNGAFGPGMMGGWGSGMMGRQSRGFGMMGRGAGGYGWMHEYMVSALAEQLGMTPEDLQKQIDAGQAPYQIAQAKGLTDVQIQDIMLKAHDAALEKAVAAGALTQEQADWMDQHMEGMWQNGGAGFGPCHGGQRGQQNSQP